MLYLVKYPGTPFNSRLFGQSPRQRHVPCRCNAGEVRPSVERLGANKTAMKKIKSRVLHATSRPT